MSEFCVNTSQLKGKLQDFKCGDKLLLSGRVYTARDAAHARIVELIENDKKLPFVLKNAVIYYAGPTETPKGLAIGSCGPTTSSRMDSFAPKLLDRGLCAMIGKGVRNKEVVDSIVKNKAIYLCAIGGAGALAAKCITESEVIAFDDLGPESIKRLEFKDFPLIVGCDCNGNSIFK